MFYDIPSMYAAYPDLFELWYPSATNWCRASHLGGTVLADKGYNPGEPTPGYRLPGPPLPVLKGHDKWLPHSDGPQLHPDYER